jgi:hypothetical protein
VAAATEASVKGRCAIEYPSFIGGSYESQAVTADAEKTVNWYPERMESPGAAARMVLYCTPGVEEIVAAATGPGRAHFYMDGREFAVIGTTFYEIGQFGSLTSRGTVALDSNPATICSNGDGGGQLFITSGGNGYCYNLSTNTLTQIAALNGIATMGGQLDGYFLVLDSSASKFYISALLNGLSWTTGTDFAQRNTAPDPWIGMQINGPYVWLFGEQTSEVWYDSGASPFPFARHPSGLIHYGIAAPFASAVANGSLVWLGASKIGDGQVLRANGFAPETISTYPLQYALNGYATISDAVAEAYNDFGHTFFLLNFPSQNVTHAWDAETLLWADRGTWIAEDNRFVAWRPRWGVVAFGEHRTLDASTGSVYRFNYAAGALDVDDREIRRLRRAPALVQENRRISYPGFEVMLESGLGTATGQGADPQMMMRFSDDGGRTWSTEQMRSAGKTGEFSRRVRWERCGEGRQRVFEVSCSDPIPWRLMGANLTPDPTVAGRRVQQKAA